MPHVGVLKEQGHEIVSSWLKELPRAAEIKDTTTALYTSGELQGFAVRDVLELGTAEAVIMDTIDVTPRGGREVEWGAFVFQLVPFGYIVGPKRNVLHELATKQFEDWETCLDYFKGLIF